MAFWRAALAVMGLGLAAGAGAATPPVPQMVIVQTWKVGGEGGWDLLAVDGRRHRLFVTRGERVDVIDADSGRLIGHIPGTHGVHGVALAQELQRGFATNGRADTVTVFDLASLAVLREVPTGGHGPDAIVYEPHGRHVFAFNGKSASATVLDAQTLERVGAIALPGKPELAVDEGAGHIYLNIQTEPGRLAVIDTHKLQLQSVWTLDGCNAPTGLALDARRGRLFSACRDRVMAVTDARDGHQVARVAIGEGPDGAAFDAGLGLVFASNGEGTLTVLRDAGDDHYQTVQTLQTRPRAKTMVLDPATHRVYLPAARFGATPPATPAQPHPRPPPVPGSFEILVAEPR